ncbi:MAG TPA: efflux RND transporter periplasmic adaptor subunit [Terriglobales bacterium]|nr:efflux RND transporter periplasmic adaptor subunit [Terriglobales bacterium]
MRVEQPNEVEQPVSAAREPSYQPTGGGRTESRPVRWWIAVLALAAVVAVILGGIIPRKRAEAKLEQETELMAVPTVSIVHPKRSAPADEVVLPANVQAYIDSPIYSRTNGYLKKWYVDIGAHVKQGQLLAEIETPEVDQQLRQARSDLQTAEANLDLAKITADRYTGLLKTESVSKQDADNAQGNYAAQKATMQAAQANVKRLEELQSFERIYAPFDGVITFRNTDIGHLIDSGSSGGTRTELFHIAQPDKLRVYVNVPEIYAAAIKPGLNADLVVPEFPGRRFPGTLVRTANAIDQTTRTLLVEIRVDNPTGTLFSGAYAEAHFKLPNAGGSSFILPVNTLLFRSEGLRVAAVGDQNRAELKPITVGHDYGTEIEVVSGLTGEEAVIVNPPDSIVSGEEVRVVNPPASVPKGNQLPPGDQGSMGR